MEKTKKIRVEKTERGVEVFIDPEVTKISTMQMGAKYLITPTKSAFFLNLPVSSTVP